MAAFAFPSSYLSLIDEFTGTKKYIDGVNGSNANTGNSIYTAYATIDYAISANTSATPTMFVISEGTYTITTFGTNASAIRDGGNHREFVCQPGSVVIQWTATPSDRDATMLTFTNASSKIYGGILRRNNNGRTTNYTVAFFISFPGRGNFYNCVFSETNANNAWSYQYDNYGQANIAIRNCTFFNAAAPGGNYANAGTCLTIDSVFNTTVSTGGTETNVLKSQAVNATTYQTTGVTTAGVYSGTYAWGQTAITPAPTSAVATGGTETTITANDTQYRVHTFTAAGTLTVTSGGSVEYLVVGGGGGGGHGAGGGGGAGGLRLGTMLVTAGSYSIVVGAGGAAGVSAVAAGNGGNSVFSTMTATGGGRGGTRNIEATPTTGGSGGGGFGDYVTLVPGASGNTPSTSPSQGNNGGANWNSSGGYGAGGGGGASVSGFAGTSSVSGAGGAGSTSSIIGTSQTYAGGGGGGSTVNGGSASWGIGGLGGGGAGGAAVAGTTGTLNTGGGGGGGGGGNNGGTGGSGIVIIRYELVDNSKVKGGTKTFSSVILPGRKETYGTHIFRSSGNLVVTESTQVQYLVVGAGGGGGSDMGGGGGAGGFLTSNVTLAAGTYRVTVGAGGAGAPAGISQVRGNTGNSSGLVPFGFKGHSYVFDGNGDNLLISYNAALHLSADFTIECWFYANTHGGMILNFAGGSGIAWASYELVTNGDGINFAGSSANTGYDIGSETGATGRIGTIQLGTWNHLAVTRSGNVYRGFVNGVQGYTQTLALTPYNPNARGFSIGANYATTWGSSTPVSVVNGYISNLRIIKGTAVYTGTFTPSTTPLTAIAGTSLLTAQDLAYQDNSANGFILTSSGNAALSHFSPFNSMGAAGGGGGASEYSNNNSPASSGGSGGGTAGDISTTFGLGIAGQGFAGGASGGRYYPSGGGGAGAPGTAVPGNGGAGLPSSILGTTYYWAGGGGGAGYSGIAGNGGIGGGGGGAPKVSGGGFAGGSAYSVAQDGTPGTLVAATNVPGGNAGTSTGGGGGGGSHYNANNPGGSGGSGIVIVRYLEKTELSGAGGAGGPNAGGGGGAGNDGYVGAVVPYTTRMFTQSDSMTVTGSGAVEYLVVAGGGGGGSDMGGGGGAGGYQAGNLAVSTGTYTVNVGAGGAGGPAGTTGPRGSNGGDSVVAPVGFKGNSVRLSGATGANLSFTNTNNQITFGSDNFTIEYWVNFTNPASTTSYEIALRNYTTDPFTTDYFYLGKHPSATVAGAMSFWVGNYAGLLMLSDTTVPSAGWLHFAVVRNGNTWTMYRNGTAVHSVTSSITMGTRNNNLCNIGLELNGYISNLRVVKGTAVYTANFTPSTQPLTAITNTSLLAAQDTTFVDNSTNAFSLTAVLSPVASPFTPFTTVAVAAIGGGGGASDHDTASYPASNGGSGGGGSGGRQTRGDYGGSPGTGLSGQGNNGAGSGVTWYPGGGGGAGAAASQTGSEISHGGIGIANSILGTTYYWAGGGGGAGYTNFGGNGGLGGGGGGAPRGGSTGLGGGSALNSGANATVGTTVAQTNVPGGNGGVNTGGGGGGGAHFNTTNKGGDGGSGIVIVKYDSSRLTITGGTATIVFQLDTTYLGGSGALGNAVAAGTTGTLGGGGGGASSTTVAGGGGGIGLSGPSIMGGAGGAADGAGGAGGSLGAAAVNGNGGLYGGGGGGTTNSTVNTAVGNGAQGALRIFWQGNILQYPYPVQANNVTQLSSGVQAELLDAGTAPNTQQLLTTTVQVQTNNMANSNVGLANTIQAKTTTVVGSTKFEINSIAASVKNIEVKELQIITYRTDEEMMLITTKGTGGNTDRVEKIERITDQNDPRRIEAKLLNYVVGVTGEDDYVAQTQIWF